MLKLSGKQVAVMVIGTALIACAVVPWFQPAGLSSVERRLLGRWTFRTIDETHQLEMFDFREDRIVVFTTVEHVPDPFADFFDWRVDGDMLVLTHYVHRQPGETVLRKARRAVLSIGERLRGLRAEREPVETLRIVRLDSGNLELQVQPLDAEPSPESVIKLVRAAESTVEPQRGGIR